MSDKIHQSSNTEYQIRIDGTPMRYYSTISPEFIADWLEVCAANPRCYVDIVSVRTEIIVNQGLYSLMGRHFNLEPFVG